MLREQDEEGRKIAEEEFKMKQKMEEQRRIKLQQQQQQQEEERRRKLQQQQQEEERRRKLQQQNQDEERRRKQMAANANRARGAGPPLPARSQTADEIFKNDPWFQNPADLNSSPIYANTLPPVKLDVSMDTTTDEIDIDAVLGYPDIAEEPELEHEMDQPVIRQIEEIIWPKSEPEPAEDEEEEGETSFSSHGKGSGKKKPLGFFNFAADKSKKQKKGKRSESPFEEPEEEVVLAADHYIEDISPRHEGEKKRFWGGKKSKQSQSALAEEVPEVEEPEQYVEEVQPKQKRESKSRNLWGGKKTSQQVPVSHPDEEEQVAEENYVEDLKPKRHQKGNMMKLFGSKQPKQQQQQHQPEEEEEYPEEEAQPSYVEETKPEPKPEKEKKKLWGNKKAKQQQPQPEEEYAEEETQPSYVEETKPKQKEEKKKMWSLKKSKPQPVPQSESELEVEDEQQQELQELQEQEFYQQQQQLLDQQHQQQQQQQQQEKDYEQQLKEQQHQQLQQQLKQQLQQKQQQQEQLHYQQQQEQEQQQYFEAQEVEEAPIETHVEEAQMDQPETETEPESEMEQEQEGQVIDVVAEATLQDQQQFDQVEDDYVDEPKAKKPPKEAKRGFGSIFQKPNLKNLTGSKKQPAKKPTKIGNIPPVDVSHLLDDDFGIEEPPPMSKETDTEMSDNNAEHEVQETSDESPNEAAPVPPLKSMFKLKMNLKKDKPAKEEKHDNRPKPAKFFKSPSFKSPSSSKRATPKTSPESKVVRDDQESSAAERDSSAERPPRAHHYSPPKVELTQQLESLNLNDVDQEQDSYIEPAPIQTSEDERRESTTADEAKYTSDEAEPVVNLPVEMEEPEPTVPIRGRPKTAKKKSGGSGLSGLFSSSRPSSRTRLGNKREESQEQDVREQDVEAEQEPEEERPFENRRKSESKGFGGLFGSKRKVPKRARPVSGPPAGVRLDDEDNEQQAEPQAEPEEPEEPTRLLRKQRSTGLSGFLFASRRGRDQTAKSTGNLAEKRREVEEAQHEEPEEKPSYNNSTSSLSRAKREKGFGAMFGAPKTRMSGRKPMPRSTTFPLPQQQPQQQKQQHPDDEDLPVQQQQKLQQSPRQPRVQESPQLSYRSEDRRPQLPLPAEPTNQYSPTPKQQDPMVYDQIEIVNEPSSLRREESIPEPPRDPNRQVGRRSGRFRRPQDGSAGGGGGSANTSAVNNSLNNSRQIRC